MTNIFVALSTHHVDYCENIVVQHKNYNNVIITDKRFNLKKELFNEVVYFKEGIFNRSNTFFSKLQAIVKKAKIYRDVKKQIKHLKIEQEITLYYSSLEDILSNHLLFNFHTNIKAVAIEDGVLNYYEHSLNDVSCVNFLIKKLIALLFNLKMESYKGHTSGIDYDKVKYQLVREPKYSVRPEKSKKLTVPKRNISSINNSILIIGQEPYGNLFSLSKYKSSLEKLVEELKKDLVRLNLSTIIYYKPHRHGPRVDDFFLNKIFFGLNFVLLDDERSIEEIYFNDLKSSRLYTFDSSAVFSIYSELPENLKDKINVTVMPFYKNVLNTLFTMLKFKILKNDF